jgi:hypothetical protein
MEKIKRGQAGGREYTVQFKTRMRRQRGQYIKAAGAIKNQSLLPWRLNFHTKRGWKDIVAGEQDVFFAL